MKPQLPSRPRFAASLAELRRRVGLIGVTAAGAALLGVTCAGEAPSDLDALAAALGHESGVFVRPDDLRWEPSSGMLADLLVGRFVLFLGSETAGGPRDLYRARVRLSPEGHPVSVGDARNLTSTPLGDDHALVMQGEHAAYATFAFGQEQSVTALDVSGEGAQNQTKTLQDQVMAWITNVQQTGSGDGIGRVDVTLEQPAQRVGLAISEKALDVVLADEPRSLAASRVARLDLEKGDLTAAVPGMHAESGRHLPKRLVFWAVDTVRAVPWIGPAPIAWLEEKTFALKDSLKQAEFKLRGSGEALADTSGAGAAVADAPATILDTSKAGADSGHWPPASIKSMWKTPEEGEGEWEIPKQPWIKHLEGAPPPFYKTFVRPDEDRPYAKVLLVAMDMRQLDLDMEAGNEDPKPMTGPPGAGRIPRDPAVYTRIAAAFNGGFKTEHGAYGMMLKKRVLLPPVPGAATVIVTKDQHVGMGSWGANKDIGGIAEIDPSEIVSFRQNLDPLLDDGKVNPLGRAQWGFTLPGTTMQTERSGLCVNAAGHLMYVWGDDVSAVTLGKAMKMAGCSYGMHLDMNPHHTGLIFTNITELKGKNYKSELLAKEMEIDTDRYILYAPKDFFFVTLHDPQPPPVDGVAWEADPGVQPAPAWMPGLWRGTPTGGGGVELLAIEDGRAAFRIRAGTREPDPHTGGSGIHELDDDDAHRVLFSLTLGVAADAKHLRGLVTDGRVAMPMSTAEGMGVVVASASGDLGIFPSGGTRDQPLHTDVVELPLLIDDGKVVPHAHLKAREPAALCSTPQGRWYVARSRGAATLDDVMAVLKHVDCNEAVLLDRGAGGHGALARAGTSTPPRARYEDTVLYAMGKPLAPRGFKFEAQTPYEVPKKK